MISESLDRKRWRKLAIREVALELRFLNHVVGHETERFRDGSSVRKTSSSFVLPTLSILSE